MNSVLLRSGLAGLMAVSMLALAPAAFAEMVAYKADLKASAEVPPVDSKGSGALTANYDTASKKLTYTVSFGDGTHSKSLPVAGEGQCGDGVRLRKNLVDLVANQADQEHREGPANAGRGRGPE